MFDWLLYLNLAEKLITFESEEGFRTAISRSYYGVFGEIRNQLEIKGLRFNQANIHQQVIEWLTSQSTSDIKKIGWDLFYLRSERNKSDYNSNVPINKLRSEKCVILARKIIQNASKAKLI